MNAGPAVDPAETIETELAYRLAQQSAIAGFGRIALTTHDLDSVLQQATVVCSEGLKTRFAKVMEFLPGENAFLARAGVGWKPGLIGTARVGADLASPAGYAFRTGEPVISNHLGGEQRFRTPAMLAEHGIQRAINVIIQGQDRPFGVIEVDSPHEGRFTEHDLSFLGAMGSLLGLAIDRIQAAEQQELLRREADHRISNSLQLVSSLLLLQRSQTDSADGKLVLAQAADRVMAVAQVHRQLQGSVGQPAVEFGRLLRALCAALEEASADPLASTIQVEADAGTVTPEQAVALGLCVNELVTNAFKHAYAGRGGVVEVTFRRRPGRMTLCVRDRGAGMPETVDPFKGRSLGMKIVRTLTAQIGATVEIRPADPGTSFDIAVPDD